MLKNSPFWIFRYLKAKEKKQLISYRLTGLKCAENKREERIFLEFWKLSGRDEMFSLFFILMNLPQLFLFLLRFHVFSSPETDSYSYQIFAAGCHTSILQSSVYVFSPGVQNNVTISDLLFFQPTHSDFVIKIGINKLTVKCFLGHITLLQWNF